jgi:hypothetical protein
MYMALSGEKLPDWQSRTDNGCYLALVTGLLECMPYGSCC